MSSIVLDFFIYLTIAVWYVIGYRRDEDVIFIALEPLVEVDPCVIHIYSFQV